MTIRIRRRRRGATLVELLLFLALVAITAVSLLPLLFTSAEDRLLQQTVSLVEQNGTQLLQTLAYRIRHAERIVSPAQGVSASVLALQSSSGSTNPTLFGVSTGALIMVQRTVKQTLSSQQVAVENFRVRNTSESGTRQSVLISFTVARTIRLQSPRSYRRTFEAVFSPFPDDEYHAETCSCIAPSCSGGYYQWQVCDNGQCLDAQTEMKCP